MLQAQSPQDGKLLKTIRYEDAEDGKPPVAVDSLHINPPKPPSVTNFSHTPAKRPRTSPAPRANIRTPTHDSKRDSGIAPSISTAGRDSITESSLSTPALGAAKEPNLPTIVVQDDETPLERSRSPFARLKSKDKHVRPQTASPASGSDSGIQRIRSFKGIQSDIPSGDFKDLELEDLASDKVGFSHRGSLLFGGKKMNGLLQSSDSQRSLVGFMSNSNPYILSNGEPAEAAVPPRKDSPPPEQNAAKDEQEPVNGLKSGRRKPSVQMLQAALQNGRVLSAEEITFSMKVRSMYEHGDENAVEWTNGIGSSTPENNSSRSAPAPDANLDSIAVSKTRQDQSNTHPALRAPPPQTVRASYAKNENELAGGIEDWDDVDGQDVDRYGFIVQKRAPSRSSHASGGPPPNGVGMQRVATALQFTGERRDRKVRRGPSVLSRASRSVPPRPSKEETTRGNGSIRTFNSNKSANHNNMHSSNPFRSRDRRTLAEASDMLTPPPGLGNIDEHDDSGKTASTLKRREWAREEKWQKMAKPANAKGATIKGGGMHFSFDTADPKLVSRTWKGIPDRWRATAWHSFLAASQRKRGIGASDTELLSAFQKLQEQSSADDVQIDVDVPRTISMHIMFRRRYRGGQRLLFRVLHAISLYFPDTGYVQGMASLAATLLCYYDEEHAFVMLVRLWQLRGLEQLFQHGFEGLMSALNEFETEWLAGGAVAQKLEELGITSTAYGTRWYLTLFNMSIPFPAQLRVWDAFMLLGDVSSGNRDGPFGGADLSILHATSAALIDATREIVLDADFENAMKVLTSFVPIRDEDLLMRVARAEWRIRRGKKSGRG